ncbi:MAG TPA: hypothetical protein GXX23_09370 [Firmicutes bacterium]|jgi:hypothetical protein|nr:hypothetical protein [Candidatus Fermentithermobacillaceae bacterium]
MVTRLLPRHVSRPEAPSPADVGPGQGGSDAGHLVPDFGSGWYDPETVVLFARESGWTVDDMDRLYRSEIPAIAKALEKQRLVDEYRDMREHWAFLDGILGLAAGLSGKKRKPKLTSPDDFLSKDFEKSVERILKEAQPAKQTDWASLVEDVKAPRA